MSCFFIGHNLETISCYPLPATMTGRNLVIPSIESLYGILFTPKKGSSIGFRVKSIFRLFIGFIKKIVKQLIGYDSGPTLDDLIARGLKIGKGVSLQPGWVLDSSHCWLISIGDNVTLAPRVYILAHDASTQRELGYTKIGRVIIGNNVFIGANSTIMPGVSIGDNVIVGANSLVSKSIEPNTVAVGNPAKVICTYGEYMSRQKALLQSRPRYDLSYTLQGGIDEQKKQQMWLELGDGIGFVE